MEGLSHACINPALTLKAQIPTYRDHDTFPLRISWENLIKGQSFVINLVILISLALDGALMMRRGFKSTKHQTV